MKKLHYKKLSQHYNIILKRYDKLNVNLFRDAFRTKYSRIDQVKFEDSL